MVWLVLCSLLRSSERRTETSIDGAIGAFGIELLESAFRKSLVVNFENLPEKAIASVCK